MECWKSMIKSELDDDETIIHCTLTEEELNVMFDTGYGGEDGKPFTAWSKEHVFFPVCYDGSEWVAKVPRDPCSTPTFHVGGG